MSRDIELVIAPPKGLLSVDWRELWQFRDLFVVLAWRDIAVRYKQTFFGVLWAIFQPVITMVLFTLIFNKIANIDSGDATPYPIFVYVGLLLWHYYSNTLSAVSNSMINNTGLLQKIYFPRLIMPASNCVVGLVDFAVAFVVLIGLMIYYGYCPSIIGIIILPLLIVNVITASLGLGLIFAAINVKYRDVRYALPFFIQLLMYVTPVIYPVSMLDGYPILKTLMLWLNPISGTIATSRAALLGAGPIDWGVLGVSTLMGAVMLAVGIGIFRNTERYFADIA